MPDNFFDRERAALLRLTEAVRVRAAAEAELAAAFQTASDKAEREVNRARKANAAARETELGEIDAAHAAAADEIARRADADQYTAARGRDERRATPTADFRAAGSRGRGEHQERRWTIDAPLEP